jgi:hypothetical protein
MEIYMLKYEYSILIFMSTYYLKREIEILCSKFSRNHKCDLMLRILAFKKVFVCEAKIEEFCFQRKYKLFGIVSSFW